MKTPFYAVVMAGGRGTRFWPLSRNHRPKQLLSLLGHNTLLRETVDRILPVFGPENTIVVTVADHEKAVRAELPFLSSKNFLSEPFGNNTAPCIGLAALEIERRQPGSVMAVLPADHWIATPASFRRALLNACRLATRSPELLVTMGVTPRYPETGFGYILRGPALPAKTVPIAYRVKRFKEKPNTSSARRIINAGGLWNSGIFVWRCATVLDRLKEFNPGIAQPLYAIAQDSRGRSLTNRGKKTRSSLERNYRAMPNISIDHAVLEPASSKGQVVTMPADFSWNDVGSWQALHELLAHDAQGHSGHGRWIGVDSRNCLLVSKKRLLVILGVEGLAVIDTPDALLVADLARSQDIRKVVDALGANSATRHLLD
jgi:mannose-1-phosphate guanylyltransferase